MPSCVRRSVSFELSMKPVSKKTVLIFSKSVKMKKKGREGTLKHFKAGDKVSTFYSAFAHREFAFHAVVNFSWLASVDVCR